MRNTIVSIQTDAQETMKNLSAFLASIQSEGRSLADCVRQGGALYPSLGRKDGIAVFTSVFGVTDAYANTIYYNYYKPTKTRNHEASDLIKHPVFPPETNMMIELIRLSLSESAGYSQGLFLDCTVAIPKKTFMKPRSFADDGRGCVYAYFNDKEEAIYVGITSSYVKSRLRTPTSPHLFAEWWPSWTHMRFLPLPSASDRQILEYLLILGLAPIANKKPGAVPIGTFLKDLEGD